MEKSGDLIKLSPIQGVYVKDSQGGMHEDALAHGFCRNYYAIQMLRFGVFIIIVFGLQNSSHAQIGLSLGMSVTFCTLTFKYQRMGC